MPDYLKWNELEGAKRLWYFVLIFIVGWLIRMVDPAAGLLFSVFYIVISLKLYTKEERPESLGLQKSPLSGYLATIIYVPCMLILFIPIFMFLPYFDDILPMAWNMSGQNIVLMLFVAWLVVGTITVYAEEILFRGFMQDAVEDMLGVDGTEDKTKFSRMRVEALVICSLLFGISHLNILWADLYLWGSVEPNVLLILIGFLCISAVGLLVGIIRIKANSLWAAIFAHSVGNFFMILVPSLIFVTNL